MKIFFFNERVRRFRDSLVLDVRPHADHCFRLLEAESFNLGMPFSRPLGKGLFELRIIDVVHVRFIYAFCDGSVWMIHGFIKKSRRIPYADVEYARKELRRLLRL